jgi:hypothetical protein
VEIEARTVRDTPNPLNPAAPTLKVTSVSPIIAR